MLHDNTLYTRNVHSRDSNIVFYCNGHKYEITTDKGSMYTSVTTFCHSNFAKFNMDETIKKMMNGSNWNETNKYWNMNPYQIKALWSSDGKIAASCGTKMHENIECFMNMNVEKCSHKTLYEYYKTQNNNNGDTSIEWSYFLKFIEETPDLVPYRTEWLIYDEDIKIAGSIDMVYLNDDGTLSIYDWKRCKSIEHDNKWHKYSTNNKISHIADTNYMHYSLQLNMYKTILEAKYGKIIRDLYLVKLHPENINNSYELINVNILADEISVLTNELKR